MVFQGQYKFHKATLRMFVEVGVCTFLQELVFHSQKLMDRPDNPYKES